MLLAVAIALGVLGLLAAGIRHLRRHPSPLPYSQRLFVQGPHPFLGRERLRRVLDPRPGERILEVGPGTGYHSLPVASWIAPEGRLEIVDAIQEWLDHTMRAAGKRGTANIEPTRADATALPHDDASFDAAFLVQVLGEVPDQAAALRELRRVLKPDGRLVVGESVLDPPRRHAPSPSSAGGGGRPAAGGGARRAPRLRGAPPPRRVGRNAWAAAPAPSRDPRPGRRRTATGPVA